MCDKKSEYIRRIFSLEHESQAVLKGLIEQVMTRVSDADAEGGLEEGDSADQMNGDDGHSNAHGTNDLNTSSEEALR